MTTPPSATAPSGGLSFTGLLNILWRWRFFVLALALLGAGAGVLYGILVTPLYVARTTIQPGITTFNAQAEPVREWQVKDIVTWYKLADYNPGVAERMGKDPRRFKPVIRASYSPRTPQSRGGDTINLSTLSPDPEEAKDILAASIAAFIEFAGADSSLSNIHLMRVRIGSNMEKQRAKIAQLAAERARVELQIAAAENERDEAEASKALVQVRIDQRKERRALAEATLAIYANMIESGRLGIGELRERIQEWEELARELQARQEKLIGNPAADPTALALHSDSINGLLQEIGSMRLGVFGLNDRLLGWEEARRQLHLSIAKLDEEIEEQRFELERVVPRKVFEAEQKIDELSLQRDYDLPQREEDERQELRQMEARLASLSPIEPIGEPVASTRPVRPRKPRAVLILLGLGLASGLFGALSLEYLSRNWREITRPGSSS